MARRTREILGRLGHARDPAARGWCASLPAAGKQVVSMARALSHDARLIIMDEPSAVLAHDEVGNLFRIIRELTAQGIAVIYISHRLEEIREIGDRVTVLKDGRTTAANLPARTTPDPGPGQPDDRPHHRVRLPGPRRAEPDRRRAAARSRG